MDIQIYVHFCISNNDKNGNNQNVPLRPDEQITKHQKMSYYPAFMKSGVDS